MDFWHVLCLPALWTVFIQGTLNQGLIDNRCYLENGASSESFFVSEDLPVGSIIGQVRIHGDPRPGGSIALRLQETDSPVSITPSSKNLTLRSRLDKEGVDGPSSVFVNLICERLRTPDPGFVIPINIRVTDANDNAPVFINAPYELNISEVTVVGTRVLQGVHAIDLDQQGPYSSVRYSVLPGPHSNFFEFENELEGNLVLRKPLDYESLKSFVVDIRAQDHGEPPKSADTTLTVHVVDADDQNPKFLSERYTAFLPEGPKGGVVLDVKPHGIKAIDQDFGINAGVFYTFNGVGGDYAFFNLDRDNARVSLGKDIGEGDLLHPATLVVRATQQDNADRYALATLTVSRKAARGLKFLKRVFHFGVSESVQTGTTVGTFSTNMPGKALRYFVSEQSVLKVFSINPHGQVDLRKCLDYEVKSQYVFKIFATDGVWNDSAVVNISVIDVNEWEPRFRYPHYDFFVGEDADDFVGLIEVADGDKDDYLTLTLFGMNASMFMITSNGQLRLKQPSKGHYGLASLAVTATDSGSPPRRASVPVTVHFPQNPDASTVFSEQNPGGHLILAGLGGVLLIFAFIVILLVAYICRSKKRMPQSELPTTPHAQSEKPQASSSATTAEKMSNPMFLDRMRAGAIAHDVSKSRIPSPKVYPAPQPPVWSNSSISGMKKLSWGDDKTDMDSSDNMNNMDLPLRPTENSNLTVYF